MPPEDPWKAIDRLIDEQKMEQALQEVEKRLAAARGGSTPEETEEWTRALIRAVQLRMALQKYETGLESLRAEPWPEGTVSRAALHLFEAQAFVNYYQSYSWEINQRERVESGGKLSLDRWTRDEIFAAAVASYLEAWKDREGLGGVPVARLAEYLQPNNYPAEIRGSLRDAVSYLFAELFANSSFWSPRESNEVYRLDLAALARGEEGSGAAAPERLADPAVHPLVKLGAVLSDLEAWHEGAGRRAGALEARRIRTETLSRSFTRAEDKELVLRDFAERLPAFRDLPWWSMGMATLAELTRERQNLEPDALRRAHDLALAGHEAYPESPGGQRSLRIAREIELPQFSIAAMTSDGPGRRSLEVFHQNVPELFFRAYRIDLAGRMAARIDSQPGRDDVAKLLAGSPVAAWRVELPPTGDFRGHKTFVTPPLEQAGAYVIVASTGEDFAKDAGDLFAVQLILGDLALVARFDGAELEVLAVSGSTGRPEPGVEVRIYRNDHRGGIPGEVRKTGPDGTVRFPVVTGGSYEVFAWKGPDAGDMARVSGLYFYRNDVELADSAFVYTDRSIYRPGQKILWKVLAYRPLSEGRFETRKGETLKVGLIDPNNQEAGQVDVETNAFGTASGEFVIPAGRPLGTWRIAAGSDGSGWVEVEEYKRPTFEITLDDPAEPLRLNRPAVLEGEARYYFGLPVAGGEARWRVKRQPVFRYWWERGGGATGSQIVAAGVAELAADGSFRIELTPEADEREREKSPGILYLYEIEAEVTDEGGETREATRSFRLGWVSVDARITAEAGFFRSGRPAKLDVSRTDLNGAPRPGEGTWTLFELRQPARAPLPSELPRDEAELALLGEVRTPGDLLSPRWESYRYSTEQVLRSWEDGRRFDGGALRHDAQGRATVTLPADLPPGAYRLRYETVDDFGARFETQKEILVVGANSAKTPLALPAVLEVEAASVPVGGTARFFVHSGLPDQTLFFETWRDSRLLERRRLAPGSGPGPEKSGSLIEIPIGSEERGGFSVRLVAVRDHEILELLAAVSVPWDDRRLEVDFASFRDQTRPGARETWRVTVKDAVPGHSGKPGSVPAAEGLAELLAYMYDRSLDAFAQHEPPNPLGLYPSRTGGPRTSTSVGVQYAQVIWRDNRQSLPAVPELYGDRLRFFDEWGIGGPGGRALYRASAAPMAYGVQMVSEAFEATGGEGFAKMADAAPAAPPPPPPPPPAAQEPGLRSDFAETAFWQPHLLTGPDGSAVIEFTVPDSVTSWNVWVHAVTADLRSGSAHRETRSVRELMVRPYLPRFLREGDEAEIKVVVNNASEAEKSGTVKLDILDPETGESRLDDFGLEGEATELPFTVAAGGGADVTFRVWAPRLVGAYHFKVTAESGDLADGELRTLPVLPSRIHLAQSRFAALKGKETRTLRFADLEKGGDPSRLNEQMVVTIDGQLFYSVLGALPYLIDYPYECTEQTLNRFVSTGIAASLFDRYPAVATMAKEMAKRETRLETWDTADPNRKIALEETPWLEEARGGRTPEGEGGAPLGLVKVLDPRIAGAERESALARLQKAQLPNGAFPWWPGGPESPYMTVYVLYGLAKAAEHQVPIPKEMVQKGWTYLADYVRREHVRLGKAAKPNGDCCWEILTFLNYVASSYPDPSWMGDALPVEERDWILDGSFRHWREHSPYLKALLALTLQRKGRTADARLVLDSILDSAKTTRDEGTFWQPEARSWLWYNDTIESHAFILRALLEIAPKDPRKDGLVQWLFLNKKLGHWKSTRATAEVLYALVRYLDQEGQLGAREQATVRIAGEATTFTFEPDRFTGKKNQIVVPGEAIDPARSAVTVEKETPGFLFASATWHFSTEELPKEGSGDLFKVKRSYFRRQGAGTETTLQPLAEGAVLSPGDEVEVQLELTSRAPAEYVHLRDPRPAGFEPGVARSGYRWDQGIARYEETRDSGTSFFFEELPAGTYTLRYRVRANVAGTFRAGPALVQSMYAPEFTAYSAGEVIRVK